VASHPLLAAACTIIFAACATSAARPPTQLYAMPTDLGEAMAPEEADPTRAAELAESALYLLDPERPGGPDYLGAARMCLLATEVAKPVRDRLAERSPRFDRRLPPELRRLFPSVEDEA
jgi:hypothetical protein